MARFIQMYTDSGDLLRRDILPGNGLSKMQEPVAIVTHGGEGIVEVSYALGHYVYMTREGETIVYHTGGNPGLRAIYAVAMDSNNGFFAIANNDRGEVFLQEILNVWGNHYNLTLYADF